MKPLALIALMLITASPPVREAYTGAYDSLTPLSNMLLTNILFAIKLPLIGVNLVLWAEKKTIK